MNRIHLIIPVLFLLIASCGIGQEKKHELLEAQAFGDKIARTPNAVVLDVRTPGEFAEGHLEQAFNVDWNGADFDASLADLNPSEPLFVYCLGGGRSAEAVAHLKELGFSDITELKGGMLQWRAQKLPEKTSVLVTKSGGMTEAEYKQLITDERTVLVDFYAEWCGPCKKMKPSLDEIAAENGETVKIVRIDVDKNPEIAAAMKIEALPTLLVIRDNSVSWKKVGYASKEELLKKLK